MIYFVGAGPGAADLITVRGRELLKQADLVIYAGSLVNPELLQNTKETCEIYNSAAMTLQEVMDTMIRGEKEGKTIVRLHTGEPSIYGAVREQMDLLDQEQIAYESCPGVSACFGAAAALNLEYTLPGISQSLIITRMAGKTAVPEKESIEEFAAHQASMAIYLSSGMLKKLQERLLEGGYPLETPVVLIYKATWKEEEAYTCPLSELAKTGEEHGITKTALVIVGEIVRHSHYQKSRLYAADFETEYRSIQKKPQISIVSFTKKGEALSKRIKELWMGEKEVVLYSKYHDSNDSGIQRVNSSIEAFAQEQMKEKNVLLFIGALGIAVRAISGSVKNKLQDSPVLVMDEQAGFVIPVLSGHVGGANELAREFASLLHAVPVITTATDLNEAFAVDVFAKQNHLSIENKEGIAKISAKVLDHQTVTVRTDAEFQDRVADLVISVNQNSQDQPLLLLTPREYVLGFGCKKGKTLAEMQDFISRTLQELSIRMTQIDGIASIDVKAEEPCILAYSREHGIPFLVYSAKELMALEGTFSVSEFVESKVQTDNVCERAALLAAGEGGSLILKKRAENGMTLAVAKRKW